MIKKYFSGSFCHGEFVIAALEMIMKDRTSFVIAQRISTVLNADKILVLDDGQIVAEGAHRQLLSESPIYREIYDSQLGNGNSHE